MSPVVVDSPAGGTDPGGGGSGGGSSPVTDYCTIADIRARLAGAGDDVTVQAAIDFASALIDAKTGRRWGGSDITYVIVDDVRTDTVVMDEEFSAVTEVAIVGSAGMAWPFSGGTGTYVLPSQSYDVRSWGIRLHVPPSFYAGMRAPSIKVTATFGGGIPPLIKEAAILLTIDRLGGSSGSSSVLPEVPAGVKSFSVEGLSVTMADGSTSGGAGTTGNTKADELLDLALHSQGGVV